MTRKRASKYYSPEVRLKAVKDFLAYATGKQLENITKDDILGIRWRKKINEYRQTAALKISSSLSYLSDRGKGKTIYTLLDDAGIAQKYGITKEELDASRKMKSARAKTIYNSEITRKRAIINFLKYATGKEHMRDITKDDILGITWDKKADEHDKIATMKIGSIRGHLAAHGKGSSILTILEDTGIAQKYGIKEDEPGSVIHTRERNQSDAGITDGTGTEWITVGAPGEERKIVIVPFESMPNAQPQALEALPESTAAHGMNGNGTIRMVLETEQRPADGDSRTVPGAEGIGISLFDQALAQFYPTIPVTSDKHAYLKFGEAPVGSSVLIISHLPLDELFLSGARMMGFEVDGSPNIGFKSDDAEANKKLAGHYVSSFKRNASENAAIEPEFLKIILKNELTPARVAAHQLASYSRKELATANSPEEMSAAIDVILDWLVVVRNSGALGDNYPQVEERYLTAVCGMERRKLGELGIDNYKLNDPAKEEGIFKKLNRNMARKVKRLELAQKRQQLQPPGIQRQT